MLRHSTLHSPTDFLPCLAVAVFPALISQAETQICVCILAKCMFHFPDFNQTLIWSTDFCKIPSKKFMQILPLAVKVFHAERQTDGGT